MTRFTDQNTEGYSQEDLDFMNDRFQRLMQARRLRLATMDDAAIKSYEDYVAEEVVRDFDAYR